MRYLLVGALLLIGRQTLADATVHGKAAALVFTEHGFSIEPPAGHDYTQVQQVVALALPTVGGFSPNVNVQVQPFKGTMEEYLTLTRGQFKANGVKMIVEKHDARSAALEFSGPFGGQDLHWYSRAFLAKNGVILATATASEAQWPRLGATLRQSVDSLRLTP